MNVGPEQTAQIMLTISILHLGDFLVLSGLLFSAHQPERAFPGKFDIWGHGHQWFHLSTLAGTMFILLASYVDLLVMPSEVLNESST